MRTKQAIRNTICSLSTYIVILVVGFVSQKVFKDVLGKEYLGLHGLFSNVMTMLAIAELGFGAAIVSNMYKPVAENDIPQIITLLQYYKKVYRVLSFVILGIGLALLPFIDIIVGKNTLNVSFRIVFLFYLADTVISYFVTYKRSIIYANQQSYYTSLIHTVSVVIMNVLQIWILLGTGNYYLYLIIKITFRVLENIGINILANKLYPYIRTKQKYSLDITVRKDIKNKVTGLLFHKIGSFIVLGSDNIIISMLPNLGLVWVGLYSNYLMIVNQLNSIVGQVFSSLTASVGNLLVEEDTENSYRIFRNLSLMNAWIYVYICISFYFVSFPFVKIWMGEEYLLPKNVVFALTINLFFGGMRKIYSVFKEAAGIFYEDRFVPLIESTINLIVSIVLGYHFGIIGVFIGTIVSNMTLFFYSYPKYVYGQILNKSKIVYLRDLIKYVFMFLAAFIVTCVVMTLFKTEDTIYQIIYSILVCLFVPNIFMLICNYKTEEFKFIYNLIFKTIKSRKG